MKSVAKSLALRCATLSLLIGSSAAPAQLQLPDLSALGVGSSGGTRSAGTQSGGGLGGGLGGLLGGLMPNVASVAAPNAAGVLGYCLKNKFLGGGNAAGVLGQLTGKPGTRVAPGYQAGQKGLLQLEGTNLPLGNLKNEVTTKLCDMVLKRAQSFL